MNEIKMNMDILAVINAVLDYRQFLISENLMKKDNKIDFDIKSREYYFSLSLPEGMRKTIADFDTIISYYGRREIIEELNNLFPDELEQHTWKVRW